MRHNGDDTLIVYERWEWTECCGDFVTRIFGEPRCLSCGHRQPENGVPPQATRRRPPWMWLPELLDRRRARRLGRQS